MKSIAGSLAVVAAFGMTDAVAMETGRTVFSPAQGVEAALEVMGGQVKLSLSGQAPEMIQVETGRSLSIHVEDYNFDGHKDFSISHIDDGMGTYVIYAVFVYAPNEKKFVPLTPRCGDEFVNLAVNKSRKTLTNTYWAGNRARSCQARY